MTPFPWSLQTPETVTCDTFSGPTVTRAGVESYQCEYCGFFVFFGVLVVVGEDRVRAVEAQIFMGGCCGESCTVGYVAMVVLCFLFWGWLV